MIVQIPGPQQNLPKRTYRNSRNPGRAESAPVTYGDSLRSKRMAHAAVTPVKAKKKHGSLILTTFARGSR